jgi:hypothetical protein
MTISEPLVYLRESSLSDHKLHKEFSQSVLHQVLPMFRVSRGNIQILHFTTSVLLPLCGSAGLKETEFIRTGKKQFVSRARIHADGQSPFFSPDTTAARYYSLYFHTCSSLLLLLLISVGKRILFFYFYLQVFSNYSLKFRF